MVVVRHNINFGLQEIRAIAHDLLRSDVCFGEHVVAFEEEFAAYHGVAYARSFGSCRSALYTVLQSLDLAAGAEVVVPAYSFYIVPDIVRAAGYVPVFAENHPRTYAMDPEKLEDVITEKTAAIIVEHPFGQPAPMRELAEIAARHDLRLIEDFSQSIGAELAGKKVGSFADAAVASMVHGKNLTTLGGGMAITDRAELADNWEKSYAANTSPSQSTEVRKNALSGLLNTFLSTRLGFTLGPMAPFYLLNLVDRGKLEAIFTEQPQPFNPEHIGRLSNLQAHLGRIQLQRLDSLNEIRRGHALRIMHGLENVAGIELPEVVSDGVGTFNALPLRVFDALAFQRKLLIHGVDTRADYMTLYAYEKAWNWHGEVLYLPCHPGMTDNDVDRVIRMVRAVAVHS